ncbi:MAG: phosphohistidine phosphatase, SixA [Polaromonas sp.]|nr:phosphohistidine phosphatase, SixA [Polaromonas sp.]
MDLILWRHAEAEEILKSTADVQSDLARKLTPRGEKQAARMAEWLDRRLSGSFRIAASPARRCEQTALVLGRKYRLREELLPGSTPAQLLEVVQWPMSKLPMLVIGHQPTLGQTIAQLMGFQESECALKKGALWWLRTREREGRLETVVVTVQTPEML